MMRFFHAYVSRPASVVKTLRKQVFYCSLLLAGTANTHAASLDRLAADLNARTPQEQAYAAYALRPYAAQLETETLERLIDMLDAQKGVVVSLPLEEGEFKATKKWATTPGDEAADTLKAVGEDAIPALSIALVDTRMTVRWRVAHLLGQIGDERCISPLLNALRDDPHRLVKMAASEALTSLGRLAVPQLLEMLEQGTQEERAQAIWSLSEIEDDRALPHLVQVAMNSQNDNAMRAISALQKLGEKSVGPIIQILLTKDTTIDQKKRACLVASKIKNDRLNAALVRTVLTQYDNSLRLTALQALIFHNDPALADLLINLIRDLDDGIAYTAGQAVAQQPPEAADIYSQYLLIQERSVQEMAFDCLSRMKMNARNSLLKILKNEEFSLPVRRQAALMIQRQGLQGLTLDETLLLHYVLRDWSGMRLYGKVFVNGHISQLSSPDPENRAGALMLLGELEKSALLPYFMTALNDPDERVRDTAKAGISRLGRLGFPALLAQLDRGVSGSTHAIGELLKSGEFIPKTDYEKVKYHAALEEWRPIDRLGQAGIAYLLEELKNPNLQTTAWAAWTLARHQEFYSLDRYDTGAFDQLLEDIMKPGKAESFDSAHRTLRLQKGHVSAAYLLVALLAKDAAIHDAAINSLAVIGEESLPLLQPLLESDLSEVQTPAIKALRAIGEPAIPVLLTLMNNESIRAEIVTILEELDYTPSRIEEEIAYLRANQEFDNLIQLGPAGVQAVVNLCIGRESGNYPEAFRVLGKTGNPALLPVLMKGLMHQSADVRKAANSSILDMGAAATQTLMNYASIGNLQYATVASRMLLQMDFKPASENDALWLASVSQDWATMAAEREAVENLLGSQLLTKDNNRRMIATSILAGFRETMATAGLAEQQALAANILDNLKDRNPEKRAAAAWMLAKHGSQLIQLIPNLINMLNDQAILTQNGEHQETPFGTRTPGLEAAQALKAMGTPALAPLLQALQSEEPSIRANAEVALSGLADPSLNDLHIALLKDPREGVVLQAIASLGESKPVEAIEPLLALFHSQDRTRSAAVIETLVKIGEAVVPAVVTKLFDPENTTQDKFILINILGQVRGDEAVEGLIAFNDSASLQVQKEILRALSLAETDRATLYVTKALYNKSWALRETASDALFRLKELAVPPLISAMETAVQQGDTEPAAEMSAVLKRISNKDFGVDPEAWQSWWDSTKN